MGGVRRNVAVNLAARHRFRTQDLGQPTANHRASSSFIPKRRFHEKRLTLALTTYHPGQKLQWLVRDATGHLRPGPSKSSKSCLRPISLGTRGDVQNELPVPWCRSNPVAQPPLKSPQLWDRSAVSFTNVDPFAPLQMAATRALPLRQPKDKGRCFALWVHRFGFPFHRNEDGSFFRQKVQEVASICPATHLAGNTYQYRCWPTWLPSGTGHRPQR